MRRASPGARPVLAAPPPSRVTSAAGVCGLRVRALGSAGVGGVRAFIHRAGAGGQDAPSLGVGGVVVAVAVGGGRELLARGAGRAPAPHVVPARPAVHGRAVRRRAHVGGGRLGRLAHDAAAAQPAARERAAAVQDVGQAGALPGGAERGLRGRRTPASARLPGRSCRARPSPAGGWRLGAQLPLPASRHLSFPISRLIWPSQWAGKGAGRPPPSLPRSPLDGRDSGQ